MNDKVKIAGDEQLDRATETRDMRLWRNSVAQPADAEQPDSSLIMLVSANGTVANVLSAPIDSESLPENVGSGDLVTSIWPGETGERIRRSLKKTIQARQAYSNRLIDSQRGQCIELLLVPQGRDRILLIARDASASNAELEQLADLAFMDSETGLPNRDWLLSELDAIVHRIRLRQGRGALICLDVREDEDLNDRFGEKAARIILATVASRLARALRGANMPDEGDDERYSAVARIGGSRFAVILPDISTGDDAEAVANRLADLAQSPVVIDGREYSLSASVGIALYPQDGAQAAELLDNGIVAVQEARFSQSSSYKFHSGTVKLRALERQDLVLELEKALHNEEFTLSYLPILAQPLDRVATVEALLRWPRPLFASRPIQEVIKSAEHAGCIIDIGEWVLANAARQLTEWRQSGHADLRLAMNLTAREFGRDGLVDRVTEILDEVGLNGGAVEFEITEHLLLRDAMRGFPACRGLADAGIRVVVDDYGTGICSFDYLSGSPVAGVKIHQKFTAAVDQNASSRAACAAITAMAHELGMQVTAEGVETESQAEMLTTIGCDFLQGFLFCQPADATTLSTYLDKPEIGAACDRDD